MVLHRGRGELTEICLSSPRLFIRIVAGGKRWLCHERDYSEWYNWFHFIDWYHKSKSNEDRATSAFISLCSFLYLSYSMISMFGAARRNAFPNRPIQMKLLQIYIYMWDIKRAVYLVPCVCNILTKDGRCIHVEKLFGPAVLAKVIIILPIARIADETHSIEYTQSANIRFWG